MVINECVVEPCNRDVYNKRLGLCIAHYGRYKRNGDVRANKPIQLKTVNTGECSVDNCDRHADLRGFCNPHYQRWLLNDGDVKPDVPIRGPRQQCEIDGCELLSQARGLCDLHYRRVTRHFTVGLNDPKGIYRPSREGNPPEGYQFCTRCQLDLLEGCFDKENHQWCLRCRRDVHLRRLYNITINGYEALLEAQGGVCAACHEQEKRIDKRIGRPRSLAVDHDHACCPGKRSCGKCIRGLLCSRCNPVLGEVEDSVELLQSMIDYLIFHKELSESNRDRSDVQDQDIGIT